MEVEKVTQFKRPLLMDNTTVIKCLNETEYNQVKDWCYSRGLTLIYPFNVENGCYVHVANANVFPLNAPMRRRVITFKEALQ